MTGRNLEYLLKPASVALIGASDRPSSLGAAILRNLRDAAFAGPIMLVNPKYAEIERSKVLSEHRRPSGRSRSCRRGHAARHDSGHHRRPR